MDKRPAHRPALPPEKKLEAVSFRLNAAQRAKLEKLGGVSWLRQAIERARIKC